MIVAIVVVVVVPNKISVAAFESGVGETFLNHSAPLLMGYRQPSYCCLILFVAAAAFEKCKHGRADCMLCTLLGKVLQAKKQSKTNKQNASKKMH